MIVMSWIWEGMVLMTTWVPSAEGEPSLEEVVFMVGRRMGIRSLRQIRDYEGKESDTMMEAKMRFRRTLIRFIFSLYFIHVQNCA